MIVEDDRINRAFLKTLLNRWGFTTVEAHNGQEAIKILENDQFDLILMDISMPVMDGLSATRYIRTTMNDNSTRIIATTAYANQENIDACYNAGMNGFISKPIPIDELNRVLFEI